MKSSAPLDNLLLLLAALMFIALCFTVVGIVPVFILIVGLVLALKSGDVENMRVTSRFVQIFAALAPCIYGVVAAIMHIKVTDLWIVIGIVTGSLFFSVEFLWIGPLTRQLPRWIQAK